VPFLRLTRDRRGIENTFLMHADRPGDRLRLLYWYRTAPGIVLGRSPLDEDAIRTIEEQHPDIEFDWPAILALSEVMTPEDEAPAKPQQREQRRDRRPKDRDSRESASARQPRESASDRETESASAGDTESASARENAAELRRDDRVDASSDAVGPEAEVEIAPLTEHVPSTRPSGLVEQLAGREIAARLRGRYAEITMRIRDADASVREALLKRAEALDPDRWDTPEAVLQGVSNADALFEQLRQLVAPKP
jgi:hypothetical protein